MAQRYLTHLPTGGKTPLPHALFLARELLRQEKARHPRDAFLLVLITDGRANLSLKKGRKPMEEVKELAAQIGTLGINALVLDTERFAPCLDLGCLPDLSRLLKWPVSFGAEPEGPGGGGLHHRGPGRCRRPLIRSCSQKTMNIYVILNGAQRSEESQRLQKRDSSLRSE